MKRRLWIVMLLCVGLISVPMQLAAQEESAEISLEENSDAFQENFYEAVKQKGIENYDKAIEFLLVCKQIDAQNTAVDFELGTCYLALKNYELAEEYLQKSVNKEPDNIWFSDALLKVYEAQNNNRLAIELAKKLITKRSLYKENLAVLYSRVGQFDEAIMLLNELDFELGKTAQRDVLRQRIEAMMNYGQQEQQSVSQNGAGNNAEMEEIQMLFDRMQEAMTLSDFTNLLQISTEGLEKYPSRPEFYHARGMALNRLKKPAEAIEYLEMGIDYVIDNNELLNNIYKELVLAYQATGNQRKVQEYQEKVKSKS